MIRIAVCDDCINDRKEIINKLNRIEEKWGRELVVTSFENGMDLCNALKTSVFDIILLDIIMDNNIDGIEVAKIIRSMGENVKIIFISSYDERIRDLFKLDTVAFIDKPVDIVLLEDALKYAYEKIKLDDKNFFTYKKRRNELFIPMNDILYFESNKYQILIHTKKDIITYNDSLKNVWNSVCNTLEFVMPHKAYIVNLKYATIKDSTTILVKDKLSITIGRVYKEDTMKRYMLYLRRKR